MAIGFPESGNRVTLVDIRQPALDALSCDVVVWYCIAGAIVAAQFASQAVILYAEFLGLVPWDSCGRAIISDD